MDMWIWWALVLAVVGVVLLSFLPVVWGVMKMIWSYMGPPLFAAILLVIGWKFGGWISIIFYVFGGVMVFYSYIYYKNRLWDE
ncbi:hypothetical protein BMS3Bbin04_01179 [bacterium BMS3Bbin04]|nr:hypothetical protein BMS3Bbin04_01179 [bacterium BMS3Bbin04]